MKESGQNTRAFLYAHGLHIEPERLDQLVREAVERLPQGLYRDDPRKDLTAEEVEALSAGGFELDGADLGDDDPLVRTAAEYAAILKTSLTTAVAAARLGVAASRIRQRLTSRPPTLYGVRLQGGAQGGDRRSGWRIPEFQFEEDELLPGMAEVVVALDPELHPIAVYRWFTTPNTDLVAEEDDGRELSPRDWLRLGLPPSAVAELASSL